MAGVSDKHAIGFTLPVVNLISREIDYPISFKIAHGESAKDLFQFGEQMDSGKVHLAIIWGLEYGWLRERFPRLRPMAVTRHQTESLQSQLMVHPENAANELADLRGAKLATYRRVPLMDRVYLMTEVEKMGQTVPKYFGKITKYPTARDAIWAVLDKKADCVVVNRMVYGRHIANRPKLKMRDILLSAPFPQAVLVGRPDRVDGLRSGLWRATEESLHRINDSPEGRQGLEFWRQERFISPKEDNFEKMVNERVAEYPVTVLKRLVPIARP
jgi:ABC-type phosphate/phosphonate transport system substrate-binding protein